MPNKITLIRDASEVSNEAESFLIEHNYIYDVYYSERKSNLPLIYSTSSYSPYEGKSGLNVFKISHKDHLTEIER